MIILHFHLQSQYKYELSHINFTFMSSSKLFLFQFDRSSFKLRCESVIGIVLCCCHQACCLLYIRRIRSYSDVNLRLISKKKNTLLSFILKYLRGKKLKFSTLQSPQLKCCNMSSKSKIKIYLMLTTWKTSSVSDNELPTTEQTQEARKEFSHQHLI